jgi:formylmethanofuran dehydrogenase subunit E
MNVIEQRVKVFLESWNLRGGELDTKASCQVCGRDLVDGKFALVDGVLVCIKCKDEDRTED